MPHQPTVLIAHHLPHVSITLQQLFQKAGVRKINVVLKGDEAEAKALSPQPGQGVMGGDEEQAVEVEALADQDQQRDGVAQHAEARVALAGERWPVVVRPGVLEQQPLDPQHLAPGDGAAVAGGAQLGKQIAA